MGNVILTDCRSCEAIVAAETLAQYCAVLDQSSGSTERFTFARCPKCDGPLLLGEEFYGNERDKEVWSDPYHLYPPRDDLQGPKVPRSVRTSYKEAVGCFKAQAYGAATLMCCRTIEASCQGHEVREATLAASLAKMRNQGIIETRMLEWAEALPSVTSTIPAEVSRDEARDVLIFTEAFIAYLYTFRDRFHEFRKSNGTDVPESILESESPAPHTVAVGASDGRSNGERTGSAPIDD